MNFDKIVRAFGYTALGFFGAFCLYLYGFGLMWAVLQLIPSYSIGLVEEMQAGTAPNLFVSTSVGMAGVIVALFLMFAWEPYVRPNNPLPPNRPHPFSVVAAFWLQASMIIIPLWMLPAHPFEWLFAVMGVVFSGVFIPAIFLPLVHRKATAPETEVKAA